MCMHSNAFTSIANSISKRQMPAEFDWYAGYKHVKHPARVLGIQATCKTDETRRARSQNTGARNLPDWSR